MLGRKNSFLSEVLNLYQSENQYKFFTVHTILSALNLYLYLCLDLDLYLYLCLFGLTL